MVLIPIIALLVDYTVRCFNNRADPAGFLTLATAFEGYGRLIAADSPWHDDAADCRGDRNYSNTAETHGVECPEHIKDLHSVRTKMGGTYGDSASAGNGKRLL